MAEDDCRRRTSSCDHPFPGGHMISHAVNDRPRSKSPPCRGPWHIATKSHDATGDTEHAPSTRTAMHHQLSTRERVLGHLIPLRRLRPERNQCSSHILHRRLHFSWCPPSIPANVPKNSKNCSYSASHSPGHRSLSRVASPATLRKLFPFSRHECPRESDNYIARAR